MSIQKRRFFKRSKHPVGNSSEKPREKEAIRQIAHLAKPTGEVHHAHHQKREEFPKISQFISELRLKVRNAGKIFSVNLPRLSGKNWVLLGGLVTLCVVIIFLSVITAGSITQYLSVVGQRAKLQAEMTLWENIAIKYPTYRDANFKVALIAYQLGDKQKEDVYLQKTLQVDPNYIYARNLEKLVQ